MKDIEIIDLDYSGLKPDYRKEEVFKKEDLTGVYIVPDYGPFFGESMRVIQGSSDLELGTHYTLDTEIETLTKLFGKPVYQYVILKDNVAEANIPITIRYQMVGKVQATRKQLLEMLEDMIIAGSNIDFENQVTNKPLTYYPSHHLQDIKTELTGYGDFVRLFAILKQEEIKTGTGIKQEFDKFKDNTYKSLSDAEKTLYDEIYAHIQNVNNPHGMDKTHINLPLVENVATATLEQDSAGVRGDLRSTPAGLKRAIEDANPETEEFIVQNELPFGYYGSGIYLPPPISGSFEGLGADRETSATILESNGWLVTLMRCFDGRSRNLYYIYNKDIKAPANQQEWVHSYVKYTHPTLTAAGLTANYVIAGSNSKVLMLGDREAFKWYICASNSTFNPANHVLKPVTFPAGIYDAVGYWTVHYCNDWIYLTVSASGTGPENNSNIQNTANSSYGGDNMSTYFYRFPTSKLTDPAVTSIAFEAVNITFQNLDKQWFSNKTCAELVRLTYDSEGLIISGVSNYSKGLTSGSTHRRRVFMSYPNPDIKNLVRFKIMITDWIVRTRDGDSSSHWTTYAIGYTLDTNTNTLTLDPSFKKFTADPINRITTAPDEATKRRFLVEGSLKGLGDYYSEVGGSWVDGIGWHGVGSYTGTMPWNHYIWIANETRNPSNDYNAIWNDWNIPNSVYALAMKQKSPFGFASFQRFYSDLYALKSGIRQWPIELFLADDENSRSRCFYRLTEGGSDDTYIERPNVQSSFIPRKIWSRKTNTGFGNVVGMGLNTPVVNSPNAPKEYTNQIGMLDILNCAVDTPNPQRYLSMNLERRLTIESDGTIVLPLLADFELNTSNKTLFVTENPAKCVAVPKSVWDDWAINAIGAPRGNILDYHVSMYIGCLPGNNNTFRSVIHVWYHLTSAPGTVRIIAGTFYWREDGVNVNGIRKLAMTDFTYDIKIGSNSGPLASPTPTNIWTTSGVYLDKFNHWQQAIDHYASFVPHTEYNYIPGQDGKCCEMKVHFGTSISTIGNSVTPILHYSRPTSAGGGGYMTYVGARGSIEVHQHYGLVPGVGFCQYEWVQKSGAAMCLLQHPTNTGVYVMLGAVFVEGNWSVFVGTDVNVTFNGRSMVARRTNFDLRDFGTYRSQTFYLYCVCKGAYAEYEMTKSLGYHNPHAMLVAKIVTNDLGVASIERYQPFTIAGFPLIRTRDAGIPFSSGTLGEAGTFSFIKRSELYNGN